MIKHFSHISTKLKIHHHFFPTTVKPLFDCITFISFYFLNPTWQGWADLFPVLSSSFLLCSRKWFCSRDRSEREYSIEGLHEEKVRKMLIPSADYTRNTFEWIKSFFYFINLILFYSRNSFISLFKVKRSNKWWYAFINISLIDFVPLSISHFAFRDETESDKSFRQRIKVSLEDE